MMLALAQYLPSTNCTALPTVQLVEGTELRPATLVV